MKIWAGIPVKPLAEGKSRLANVLDPQTRIRLNSNLFRHTLKTVRAVFPPGRILVISRDAVIHEIATSHGAHAIAEQGNELNAALFQAAAFIPAADALLAISADLPNLTPEDLSSILEQPEPVTIAPDRARKGTNALLTNPAARIPYQFGTGSFEAHIASANAQGITPRIVTRLGLAFDLDTEADLALCPKSFLD